jgi:hypothetical protein
MTIRFTAGILRRYQNSQIIKTPILKLLFRDLSKAYGDLPEIVPKYQDRQLKYGNWKLEHTFKALKAFY